jgi:hypothetical protein
MKSALRLLTAAMLVTGSFAAAAATAVSMPVPGSVDTAGRKVLTFIAKDPPGCARQRQSAGGRRSGEHLACGAGLSGKPSSAIGFEERWNPPLSQDLTTFIRELTANIPPRPTGMARIVASNISA